RTQNRRVARPGAEECEHRGSCIALYRDDTRISPGEDALGARGVRERRALAALRRQLPLEGGYVGLKLRHLGLEAAYRCGGPSVLRGGRCVVVVESYDQQQGENYDRCSPCPGPPVLFRFHVWYLTPTGVYLLDFR